MTRHWIRTNYVPEHHHHLITPNKWYELFDVENDHEVCGSFINDSGKSEFVFVEQSSWLRENGLERNWEYRQTPVNPNNATPTVLVPKQDLEEVETARVELFNLLAEQCKDLMFVSKLTSITSAFYKVGNTNYPKVD